MASVPAIVVLVLVAFVAALLGFLAWRRRRRANANPKTRRSGPLPRVPLRSQVIVLQPGGLSSAEDQGQRPANERAHAAPPMEPAPRSFASPAAAPLPSTQGALPVHDAPTREFAAHSEALATLTMPGTTTRALSVHEARTREFTAAPEAWIAAKDLRPPARSASERRQEDATFKLRAARTQEHRDTVEGLSNMLAASPTPGLGNIEIYYRLALAHLGAGNQAEARRCFLIVEGVSPGYRDSTLHLAQLPVHGPTTSGPSPVHHVGTSSGLVPTQRGNALERWSTRGRSRAR